MVSQVKSLSGLVVLWPFQRSKISSRMQEDIHEKTIWQKISELVTLSKYSTMDLVSSLSRQLVNLGLDTLLEDANTEQHLDLSSLNEDMFTVREWWIEETLTRVSEEWSGVLNQQEQKSSNSAIPDRVAVTKCRRFIWQHWGKSDSILVGILTRFDSNLMLGFVVSHLSSCSMYTKFCKYCWVSVVP